jgi:hypothetical protein
LDIFDAEVVEEKGEDSLIEEGVSFYWFSFEVVLGKWCMLVKVTYGIGFD